MGVVFAVTGCGDGAQVRVQVVQRSLDVTHASRERSGWKTPVNHTPVTEPSVAQGLNSASPNATDLKTTDLDTDTDLKTGLGKEDMVCLVLFFFEVIRAISLPNCWPVCANGHGSLRNPCHHVQVAGHAR